MYDLTICSIFRQSESYLQRYISQITTAFNLNGGKCNAIWLEGDSTDNTYDILQKAKIKIEDSGSSVNIIKYNINKPYWPSINNIERWRQLSSCWNKCLDNMAPTKNTICVESDLIWEPDIISEMMFMLDDRHHVICPMLMIKENSLPERFYDTWGFSRYGQKFSNNFPYWINDNTNRLLELTSGGGMIISTYDIQKNTRFDNDTCIMKFSPEIKIFMDKQTKIYHVL